MRREREILGEPKGNGRRGEMVLVTKGSNEAGKREPVEKTRARGRTEREGEEGESVSQ